MNAKYRINPDFVDPEPTAADTFDYCPMPDTREKFDAAVESKRRSMFKSGATQWRVSMFENGDGGAYPDGLWFEGWRDPKARQLPFGEAEQAGGPRWPPLTYPTPEQSK